MALRAHFKDDGTIAIFDTENSSQYIVPMIKEHTGITPIGFKSRNFDDLAKFIRKCQEKEIRYVLIDSVTHVWRNVMQSYQNQLNESRKQNGMSPLSKLPMHHWGPIKEKWNVGFADEYVNAPMHVVVCGRQGDVWDTVEDDEGNDELRKTGIKMKTETEFGYEPSLLIHMRSFQEERNKKVTLKRIAKVLGDRFDAMDGAECVFGQAGDFTPGTDNDEVYQFFLPHIELLDGKTAPTVKQTEAQFEFDTGEYAQSKNRRDREIIAEEIQGELVKYFPGQTKEEKQAKAMLIEKHFATKSWTKIQKRIPPEILKQGLESLRRELEQMNLEPKDKEGDGNGK